MNRVELLLGIPNLPERAFTHVGDKRIKPEGGGGGGKGGGGGGNNQATIRAQEQAVALARRIAGLEAAAAARAAEQAAAQAAAQAAQEAAAAKAAEEAAAAKAAQEAAAAKAVSDAEYAAQSPKYVAASAAGKSSLRIDTGMNPYGASRGRQGLGIAGQGMGLGI